MYLSAGIHLSQIEINNKYYGDHFKKKVLEFP